MTPAQKTAQRHFLKNTLTRPIREIIWHLRRQPLPQYTPPQTPEAGHLIVFCVDENSIQHTWTVINSILCHARQPETITIGLLADCSVVIPESLQKTALHFEIRQFDHKKTPIEMLQPRQDSRKDLNSDMNLAQFFLAEYFPDWNWALYLDTDLIVQRDITDMWREFSADRPVCCSPMGLTFRNTYAYKLGRYDLWHIDPFGEAFHGGVIGYNLDFWRQHSLYKNRILPLIKKERRRRKPFFRYVVQPLLNLAFYREIGALNPLWNVYGFGSEKYADKQKLDDAYIIHWSGHRKPWLPNGYHKEYWQAYEITPDKDH